MWDELLKIISTLSLKFKTPLSTSKRLHAGYCTHLALGMQVSSELTYVKVALHEDVREI